MSNEERVVKLYKEGLSIRETCKKLSTDKDHWYPSRVYKILNKHGVLRSKSEVQKKALATGKVKHPTQGKTRGNETKLKISQTMEKYWEELSDEDKKIFAEVSKDRWENRSESEKIEFQKAGIKAIRNAAEVGSKMEFFVVEKLKKAGFMVQHHKSKFLANENLEVDILLPEIKTVIEVDGPSHQLPIWGDEAFKKRQKLDADKNGLLLNNGYVIIRFKFNNNKVSLYNKTKYVEDIIALCLKIKNKFPSKNNRYYEIKI